MLQAEETKQTTEPNVEQNPYVDATLMKDLETFNAKANTEFISKHEIETFPKTIKTPPESQAYEMSDDDLKICKYLYNEYLSQIEQFNDFGDDIIYRFMSGYRHIRDYDQRLQETDQLFSDYLAWRKSSNFEEILDAKQINNVPINDYIEGCYVYGQDMYGHPIFIDEGLKYSSDSDLSIYRDCGEEGTDQVLGYLLRLLEKIKKATNKYYGLETKLNCIGSECEKNDESKERVCGDKVGIIKHVVLFDLGNFSAMRVISDMKINEYYMRRFSLLFPEMIHKAYVINTPWMFKQVWKIVKGFLHPNTVGRTVILGSDYEDELFKEINPDFLPKKFGGNGKWEIVNGDIPKDYPIQY